MKKLAQMKDEEEVIETKKRHKKELFKNDFYKFQMKNVKKDALDELQKGFEQDKIKLIKRKRQRVE